MRGFESRHGNKQRLLILKTEIMKGLFEAMGYNCPDLGLKAQLKMFAQIILIGAIMSIPLLAALIAAGWMDKLSGLYE